ncbi:hypothetical protein IU501_34640 [Nocardia otitidiscaviarum]|uniref:hypothetical protein n=1 Tax=Nocardia otitidiscaviarum TaxID=1823 RepID=UPI0004A76029|nr:hypothetical protein [Nocardia otitidiscaviarum]MBF6138109.1 hypothetical protein [Nocardia otitidiscaviarum]
MTGTTEKKTPPSTDEEWARDTTERLDLAEHPESLRAGAWTLSTHPETGSLIASHVGGGSVELARRPEQGTDPDEVAGSGMNGIKLVRSIGQAAAGGTTTIVAWNAVVYQSAVWNVATPVREIIVPEDGIYLVLYRLMWDTDLGVVTKAMVFVDGVATLTQEFRPHPDAKWWQGENISDTLSLSAGQVITCGAFTTGSTKNIGPSGPDRESVTSLTLIKLPITLAEGD